MPFDWILVLKIDTYKILYSILRTIVKIEY